VAAAGAGAPASAAPHSPQKDASSSTGEVQEGQTRAIAVPQLRQNFFPAVFAVPQAAHSITAPRFPHPEE
jgi:hypothetical protein